MVVKAVAADGWGAVLQPVHARLLATHGAERMRQWLCCGLDDVIAQVQAQCGRDPTAEVLHDLEIIVALRSSWLQRRALELQAHAYLGASQLGLGLRFDPCTIHDTRAVLALVLARLERVDPDAWSRLRFAQHTVITPLGGEVERGFLLEWR